ncbi:hypothetical protein LT01_14070 [Listeria monocytogenes]|nr:hypothetical protein [Listeria monocytogenes]EAC9872373.1 hypothetical protein [Listeria monocytogenes]EAC9920878.1 hypothetical protein [Listeria monocytogenes]EAE6568892.1 hypothetical protein [Listeria monocytogenes]
MKYYKLMLNNDKKKWKKYEVFSIDFYNNMERIAPKDAYPYLINREYKLKIKAIKKGESPDFASIGTYYLIANARKFNKAEISFNGLELLNVAVEAENNDYVVFHFNRKVDCVDFNKSEYIEWPSNYTLEPWENSIAQFFLKPTLQRNKIPSELECFSLDKWGGAFNLVVSEKVRDKLASLDEENFLCFQELDIV